MGNLSSLRPCEVTTKYTYDDRGNKISEVYANGAKKTYEYNNRNLVVKTQSYDKEGTKTLISRYRYDDYGQLLEMTDYRVSSETETAYRHTEYTYDQRGRITAFAEISQNAQPTADDIKAHQIRYTYNENGNLSKVSYPTTKDGIQSLSYIYDENGWLQEIKGELHSKGQTTEKVLRSYSYDAYGKVKEIKDYRNRLKNGAQAVQKIYTYDSFDRVKEMIYTDLETGKVMESYQYSYDKNSNITKKTQVNNYPKEDADKVNETKSYTYDTLGRLTKTVTTDHNKDDKTKTVTYTYDNVGNRLKEDDGTTTTSYTYNGLDQLKTSTKEKRTAVDEVRQYSYDANGNQTDVKNTKTGQTESYTYDAENRLSKVAVTDKDGKTAVIQQNRYNGEGQRIQKVEGSKTTNYYYQDGVVSYTTDGDNIQTSQNLIGTDGNILATQRYGSDHTDYLLYHKDIQGSSTSLVKEDGSADATYRYTDFGETTINGDNKAENEVCYTGGIYDQRTGLYYLNARYYNPEDGGFLTEDAYRGETNEPDTQNLYVYCADNPINYIDSSGNKKKRVDFWNIAFKSNTQNYYAFNQNAPQKYAGYNDLYDVMDWTVGDLVTKKVETTWWRLQFWKGKYGATYVPKISNGCEIGLYYRTIKGNPHWYCAYDRNRRIRMRMSLYVGNRKLFTRDSKTSTDQGKAWWLTAFVFKEDMPGKDIYSKTTLRMTGTLWFPKTGKYAKQMQTLSNKLKKVKELKVKGSSYVRTFSWKGK